MTGRSFGACVLLVAFASTACASTEGSASSPAPAREAQGRAGAEPATTEHPGSGWVWRSEALAGATAAPGYLLGVVGQRGVEHCPEGGYEGTWLDLRPSIGRVSVSGPDDPVFDPLMDEPVLALGEIVETPSRALSPAAAKVEPCMPEQRRSDWRATPRGIRIERDAGPLVEHFRVDAVRRLHELQARIEGDHVVVSLMNPVPVALTDVELRVHYEGCFGKPGSMATATVIGELGVGAGAGARVPWLSDSAGAPAGRRVFRAYSVQLVGRGEGVVIDLDVPLAQLGAAVECPRR